MFNIVEKRRWFFLLSTAVILPGVAIMLFSTLTTGAPFRLSIDFLGGSIYELKFDEAGASEDGIRRVFAASGDDSVIIQQIGAAEENRWSVRAGFHDVSVTNAILDQLAGMAPLDRDSFPRGDGLCHHRPGGYPLGFGCGGCWRPGHHRLHRHRLPPGAQRPALRLMRDRRHAA